jgi:hypothetical protein
MIGLIKLTTGEELVGEIKGTSRRGTSTTILNPLKIIYKQNIDGLPITFVQRYQMFAKNPEVQIFNEHIVSIGEARASFVNYYRDAIKHYEQSDSNIDKQLTTMMQESNEDNLEALLRAMPKGSTIN